VNFELPSLATIPSDGVGSAPSERGIFPCILVLTAVPELIGLTANSSIYMEDPDLTAYECCKVANPSFYLTQKCTE